MNNDCFRCLSHCRTKTLLTKPEMLTRTTRTKMKKYQRVCKGLKEIL